MSDKTLIIAPAWIGDMIMSQPLYQLIKKQKPEQKIDILAPKSTLVLAKRIPQIDRFIEQPLEHGQLQLITRYKLGKSLRRQYSNAIVLSNSLKSALIPWWAKIKRRTGYLGEHRYVLLNDIHKLDQQQYPLLIQRYAALTFDKDEILPDVLPNPSLQVSAENLSNCLSRLNVTKDQRPILALCPGAEFGSAKRWPIYYYAKVAKHYLDKNWQVWIFGSPKESHAAEKIQAITAHSCVNLVGKTSLLDAIDLLSIASVAVSNDSGLMHIAAAVGIPVVAIYGSTSPNYTPPATKKAQILQLDYPCQPCFKRECPLTDEKNLRCLLQLKPDRIINAIEEIS